MDLLNLFQANKKFERISLKTKSYAASESSIASGVSVLSARPKSSVSGTDYVKQYVDEENEKALQAAKCCGYQNDGMNMDGMSVGTVPTVTTELENQELTKIYNTFDFEYRPKDNLPIVQSKDEITSTIQTHSITVIEGVTGCGKSTQVPQFILDSCYKQRRHCNIIVTQPRRIAALSIAQRVSQERGWPLGSLVGVQVGMYRNISKDTRLTYCTTGVLLRKLISSKNMLEYSHVILDEVHERDQEMDFLLLVIRKLLRTNSRHVRVVLMSATFNVTKFSQYFSVPTETGFVPAPVITIPKKRNFKVHHHYLCQLQNLGALPEISISEPKVTDKMMLFCVKLISVFDDIDSRGEYDPDDLEEYGGEKPRHSVLVFLPGIWEIEEMHNYMTKINDAHKWDIVVLHSSITNNEQAKIFRLPPKGFRRIILSTNIAESSITIDDIKYVVDFCLTKQLVTDPSTNFQCLELTWASKANCEQRGGRAGRVMDGRVYRLIPKLMYERLPDEGDPEIVRAPLETLVLQTKLLDMGEPKAILALAIDPPDLTNLERTILLLKEAGGLLDKPNTINRFDGQLTDLGRIMAALPIEIHLAKLIALGHVFNVLRDTIIMAASMSLKSIFSNPFLKLMEAYSAKVHWADGSTSDSLAFLNAYRVWQRDVVSNRMKKKSNAEKTWAHQNYIQIKTMHEVDYLVSELTSRLERLGIKETVGPKKLVMDDVDRGFILKIVIAGAFYPNYFARNFVSPEDGDQTQGTKGLGGLDPTRTVFLQGWKANHPGKLYAKRIQECFKDVVPCFEQTLVEFDGSSRIYIMFSDDKLYGNEKKQAEIPGKVSPSVYKALKMRKIRSEFNIPVLDLKTAKQRAESMNISSNACSMFFSNDNYKAMKKMLPPNLPILPPLDVSSIPIKIVYFVNPSKFWVHINDSNTTENVYKLNTFLNDPKNILLKTFDKPPKIGELVATKNDDKMYRATVEGYYNVKGGVIASVLFIDIGTRTNKRVDELRMIDNSEISSLRAMAFECTLSSVEPSKKKDARGFWSDEACDLFVNYTQEKFKVFGTVYSVVDSVVSLEVISTNPDNPKDSVNLNELFLKEGLADYSDESYLSKYNHKLRKEIIEYHPLHREYLEYLQYDKHFLIRTYPDPPSIEDCRSSMNLKGPFSPLEISFSSLAIIAASKRVYIENSSVNSIILDTDPEDPHERLLVASVVSQSPTGSNLTLRNTTLMPNIPGLTALICLIFAPRIELRRSTVGTRYVGALCGLGFDPKTDMPLLPEHDIEIHFDTEVTLQDMQNINRLRHWLNMGICVKVDEVDDLDEQAVTCQHKVSEFLRNLIEKPTKTQVPEKILNFGQWRLYDESLFLLPTKATVKEDSIYPLHCALQLEDREDGIEDLISHLYELRSLTVSDPKLKENITAHCQLCDHHMIGRDDVRIHLFSDEHRNLVNQLGIKLS